MGGLSERDNCTAPSEPDGIACCEWVAIDSTNNGVAASEQRKCCDRTLLPDCFASLKRIKQCTAAYQPDETLQQLQHARTEWDAAEAVSAPLQAKMIQVQADYDAKLKLLREAEHSVKDHTRLEKEWTDQANKTAQLLVRQPHRKTELEAKITKQNVKTAFHATKRQEASERFTQAQQEEQVALVAVEAAEKQALAAATNAEELKVKYEADMGGGECCAFVTLTEPGANPSVVKWECCNADGCHYKEEQTTVSHQECNWNGQLGIDGCKCDASHGGLDCSVESTDEGCFNGERANGERPDDRAACATCYKCQGGGPAKSGGIVTVAGDDRCLLHRGKEELCLSCQDGAGLIRIGDADLTPWNQGYRQLGYCAPFPKISIRMAQFEQAQPLSCESSCHPTHNHLFSQSKLMWCSKVCSSWNMLHVEKAGQLVATASLCQAVKQTHCHTDVSTTLSNIEQKPHKCFSKKAVKPWAVCYSKQASGSTQYSDGFGESCNGALNLNSDQQNSWIATRVSDINSGAGGRWCCFSATSTGFQLPDWMKESEKPNSYWCSSVAMQI